MSFNIAKFISCHKFSLPHRAFLAAVASNTEPKNFKEAILHPEWRAAMQDEINALEANRTWTLVSLPPGKRAISCQWVYRIKYRSDGSIERYKARLVIHGNRQQAGIDFSETFAPTVKLVTVRAFLAVAAIKGFELHQMDVRNAFLHGDLAEEVYMTPPPGFSSPGLVCRLQKSLYGLRQAPRCWFAKLSTALTTYGFTQSVSDYSLFTLHTSTHVLYVLVYVDDLVIAGNRSDAILQFKTYLGRCFHMKDLGPLKYFLGLEVARSSSGIFVCQRKYALYLVGECGLLDARPISTPMEENHQLATVKGQPYSDPSQYRRLIGRLIYLTITHPGLCYSVHILSQFMHDLQVPHWDAAIRVVRYLKTYPAHGLLFRSTSSLSLHGYCDADWAACPLTRRSLTAYVVYLGDTPISWKTKKQPTVSRSSAEAEYRALAVLVCELKWLASLFRSLGITISQPIPVSTDSQSALHIAHNPVFHERTKHIEVDCHFIRDEVSRGFIHPSFVSSSDQVADLLTKSLGKTAFHVHLSKLGVTDLHFPT